MSIRIGTSGWNYDHWRGRLYPASLPQKKWFDVYSSVFDTVEINNTFYHQPPDATFDAWREQAPKGFLYAVKANRYLTHLKRLKDPAEPLERFLRGAKRLREHLGPILYQLPPNWSPNLERLEAFIGLLPDGLSHVIEFRNGSWLCDETYGLLEKHGVVLCVHDMFNEHPRRITGAFVYLRFHGIAGGSGGKYGRRKLRFWAEWIREVASERDVFAYFNNDAEGFAVSDARLLRQMLGV